MKDAFALTLQPAIDEALGKLSARQVSLTRWELDLSNGKPLRATAHREGDWLFFEAPLSNCASTLSAWKLLSLNAELPGSTKLTLSPRRKVLQLRADLPLFEEMDAPDQVSGAFADLKQAAARAHGAAPAPRPAESPTPATGTLLGQLCEEAGWFVKQRPSGALAVELETGSNLYLADVRTAPLGAAIASVDIADCSPFSETSRKAAAVFLLVASGLTRLARAAMLEDEGSVRARFEVRFEREPRAREIGHALGALSVACREFGREARALGNEEIARVYSVARNHGRIQS
jgi:hypothetical protein